MKRIHLLLVLFLALTACTDGKIDEAKLNKAGEKLQQNVEVGVDSIVTKVDRFADSLGNRRDTTYR